MACPSYLTTAKKKLFAIFFSCSEHQTRAERNVSVTGCGLEAYGWWGAGGEGGEWCVREVGRGEK